MIHLLRFYASSVQKNKKSTCAAVSVSTVTLTKVHNMASNSFVVAKEEDPFSFLHQLPPIDFGENGYGSMDWPSEMAIQQESYFDAIPLMGSVPDPLCASQDIVPVPKMTQGDLFCACDNWTGIWSELGPLIEQPTEKLAQAKAPLMLCEEEAPFQETKQQRKVTRRYKLEEKLRCSKFLSRETISQYFYMPITKAAKELNVGLTLLKKRCRELNIRRWPHRKLMSLQTLIKNVQELQTEGDESEERLSEAIGILEKERKLIEERPDLEMEDTTKRLRQACFKANYKKRKLMGTIMGPMVSTSSCSSHHHHQVLLDADIAYDEYQITGDEDLEEMGSLFSCSSSNSIMMI